MSDKTYTEDEAKALVAQETAGLRTQLDELKASLDAQALDEKIAEALVPVQAQVEELQAKLDEATINLSTVTDERDGIVAFLDEAKATAERETEIAARKEERLAQVATVATFPADYMTENADRWAAMEEDAFALLLADYKAVSEKASAGAEGTKIPVATAMVASQEETVAGKTSAIRDVLNLRTQGVDARTVTAK